MSHKWGATELGPFKGFMGITWVRHGVEVSCSEQVSQPGVQVLLPSECQSHSHRSLQTGAYLGDNREKEPDLSPGLLASSKDILGTGAWGPLVLTAQACAPVSECRMD